MHHLQTLNPEAPVAVGQEVYCGLYGGKYGVVVAIYGEQSPATCQSLMGGVGVMGGSAKFDIIWNCGTESRKIPESLLRRSVQWDVFDHVATSAEIETAKENLVKETLRREEEAREAKRAFDEETEALKQEFSFLKTADDESSSPKRAAANIRILLKRHWPTVKFSVRVRDYNCCNIRWVDGPTNCQVSAVVNRFKGGYFDGMTDCYSHEHTPFNQLFGDLEYLFTDRDTSDEVTRKAIDALWLALPNNLKDIPRPSVETCFSNYNLIPCLELEVREAIRVISNNYDTVSQKYVMPSYYPKGRWLLESLIKQQSANDTAVALAA